MEMTRRRLSDSCLKTLASLPPFVWRLGVVAACALVWAAIAGLLL